MESQVKACSTNHDAELSPDVVVSHDSTFPGNLDALVARTNTYRTGLITIPDFIAAQESDPRILAIKQHLLHGRAEQGPKMYKMVQDIVCRIGGNDILRPYLPLALLRPLVHTLHYTIQGAHKNAARITADIGNKYYYPSLRKYVDSFIDHCFYCLRNCTPRIPDHTMGDNYRSTQPRTAWAVDLSSGWPKTADGHSLIYVFVDLFSLYVFLIPAKTKTATEILEAFRTYIVAPFGIPQVLRSDRESGIVNSEVFRNFLRLWNIQLLPTAAFSPQSNGVAERHVGKLKDLLRTYCNANQAHSAWDADLFMLALAHNKTTTSFGYSPEEIMFGNRLPSQLDLITRNSFETDYDPQSPKEYAQALMKHIDILRTQIYNAREKHAARMKEGRNSKERKRIFVTDQLVMLRDNTIKALGAIKCRYTGPFIIRSIAEHGNTAILENLQTNNLKKAHFSHLTPIKSTFDDCALHTTWDKDIDSVVSQSKDH